MNRASILRSLLVASCLGAVGCVPPCLPPFCANGSYGDPALTLGNPDFEVAPSTSYAYRVAVRGHAISSDSVGNFVVVWKGDSGTAYGLYGVFGQRYDSLGAPQGDPFRISSESTNTLKSQQIAIDHNPDGSFVTAWSGAPAGSDFEANHHPLVRVFNADGSPAGTEVTVNETSSPLAGNLGYGSVDVASTGAAGFVVVWSGNTLGYGPGTIYGQRFDTVGAKSGTVFVVNSYTSGSHVEPMVDSAGDGTFVVAWTSRGYDYSYSGRDGAYAGVLGQRFLSNGAKNGTEFVVNTFTTYSEDSPSIAVGNDGSFVVAWRTQWGDEGYIPDGQGGVEFIVSDSVTIQRFDSSGQRVGVEEHVNTYTSGHQLDPSVAVDDDGSFVVAWHSASAYKSPDTRDDPDGSGGLFMRCFDSAGNGGGSEFHLNSYTTGTQHSPTLSTDGNGSFVAVWNSTPTSVSGGVPFARRFTNQVCDTTPSTGPPFRVTVSDGDHLWPADPVIRYAVGVTNDTATTTDIVVTEHLPRLTTFSADQSSAGWSCEGNDPGDACTLTLAAVAPGELRNVTFAVEVEAGTSPLWWVYNIAEASSTSTTVEVSAQDATPSAICDPSNFNPTTCHLGCYIAPSICADRTTSFVIGWLAAFTRGSIGYPELHIRDNILAPTRGGPRAIDLFYEHSANAVAAAMSDASVAATALTSAATLAPLFLALADSEPSNITITQADVDALTAFTDALRAASGPDLAAALDRELLRLDIPGSVGLGFGEAILKLNRLTCAGFEAKLFCGEINGDCRITATDALGILRMAVGLIASVAEADIDGSGGVSATDALQALVIAVGINPPTEACNG